MTIFTAIQKREAIERELTYRRRVFARLVATGKMKQSLMDSQIEIFESIREDYSSMEMMERLI